MSICSPFSRGKMLNIVDDHAKGLDLEGHAQKSCCQNCQGQSLAQPQGIRQKPADEGSVAGEGGFEGVRALAVQNFTLWLPEGIDISPFIGALRCDSLAFSFKLQVWCIQVLCHQLLFFFQRRL